MGDVQWSPPLSLSLSHSHTHYTNWQVAVKMSRRGVYQIECDEPNIDAFAQQVLDQNAVVQRDEDVNWVRETIEGDKIDLHKQ